jgi:hypothetical protein
VKQYECVQVDHHKRIPQVTEEYLIDGWILYSYQAVSLSMTSNVRHYLLFEKEDSESRNPTIEEAIKLRAEKG